MRRHRGDRSYLAWATRCACASSALCLALLGLGGAPAHARATLFDAGADPLAGLDVGLHSVPAAGDLDADGDLDLVSGERSGSFHFFENTGTARLPAFTERTRWDNPLDGRDVGFDSAPALLDLDGDGDLDLVSGNDQGGITFYTLPEPGAPSLFAAGASLLAWLARRRARALRD